jgi:hypothetical protein
MLLSMLKNLFVRPTSIKPYVSCRSLALVVVRPGQQGVCTSSLQALQPPKDKEPGLGLAKMYPQRVKCFLVVKRKTANRNRKVFFIFQSGYEDKKRT